MRIPAELKVLGLAAFSILVVVIPAPQLALMALILVSFMILARANAIKMWRMLLPALPFIVFICGAQAILTGGTTTIAKLWIVNISKEGVQAAIVSAARIGLLYLAGSSVTVTTPEMDLALAIRRFLSPFGKGFGRDISTMMMLALAFMPTIAEEYSSIRMAQEARGISYRGPVKAIKGIFSIAVPLLYALSSRADRVAAAMESRCYGLEDSQMKKTLPQSFRRL